MATVTVTPAARKELARLPKDAHRRVWKALDRLRNWPQVSGVKALAGTLAGRFRLRIGEYRARFSVDGDTVTVDKIGKRGDFYDD
jgi:mRNA interferase RelE/StbE